MIKNNIKTKFDSLLTSRGFSRNKLTWSRVHGHFIDVIHIQLSGSLDSVTLNFGINEANIYSSIWGYTETHIDEANCIVRSRMGRLDNGVDIWINPNSSESVEKLSSYLVEKILPFFEKMHSLEEMCKWLSQNGSPSKRMPLNSVYLALIKNELGHKNQACQILKNLMDGSSMSWKIRFQEVSDRLQCDFTK